MYSILILFFALPLYFSHVFSPLGLIIGEVSSFERQKVYLFCILVCLAGIEWLIRYPDRIWKIIKDYGYIFLLILILPIFATVYFRGNLDVNFFLGSYEKHHGYVFYGNIVGFIILMMASPIVFLKKYLKASLYSAIIIACIAIWERIGWIYDIYGRSEMISLYTWRSSSTLGNPNYVAGYLLAFIPICIFFIKNKKEKIWNIIALIIIFIGIATTGSYIAMSILCSLIVWYGIRYFFKKYTRINSGIIFLIYIAMFLWLGYFYIGIDKLLSLQSRWILVQESIRMMLSLPSSFLIGFGPESIMTHFSSSRSLLVDQYFPQNMIIDSTHNMIIDIWFQYWMLPIFLIGSIFYSKNLLRQHPLIVPSIAITAYFLLNVMVISHVIVLVLFMTIIYRDDSCMIYKNHS
jgi:hypothetical protein